MFCITVKMLNVQTLQSLLSLCSPFQGRWLYLAAGRDMASHQRPEPSTGIIGMMLMFVVSSSSLYLGHFYVFANAFYSLFFTVLQIHVNPSRFTLQWCAA